MPRKRKIITGSVIKEGTGPWTQLQLFERWGGLGLLQAGSAIIRRIGEAQALKQSVVTGATDVLSQDVGKVEFQLVSETRSEVRIIGPAEHPWARKLKLRPNRWQTWVRLWLQVISHLALHQEAFIYKRRASRIDTEPELIPLRRDQVTQTSDAQSFYYDVTASTTGEQTMLGFGSAHLSADDIVHIVARSRNGYEGLSTLSVGSDVLGLNAMMIDFQAALAKSGVRPAGIIMVPELMDDQAFERLKAQISAQMDAAAQSGKPLVLEQDAKWQNISLDAKQTDLVKARQQVSQEVTRLLRMPAHKVGMFEDNAKYSNLETLEKAYVDDTVVPICEVVEQEFSAAFLSEQERLSGLCFRFNREQLYERDPAARRERIEKQFAEGLLYLNEARAALAKPPVADDQDHRRLPVNSAMVFRDGRVQIFTSKTDPRGDANDTAPADAPKKGLRLVQ